MSASTFFADRAVRLEQSPVSPREPQTPADPIEPEQPPPPHPRDPDPYPRYEDVPPAQPIDRTLGRQVNK
jgi:hypothetical protein